MSRYNVGAYIRLSRDESYSDSDSIDNQIKLADYYCENNDLRIVEKYIDNGYSGTTFDRPGFQNLLRDIECGLINTVIVKDLSRLGRNYIQVGYYLHYYFPDRKIRFISINDDFDSLKHDNIMERLDVPLKNMMYDHMAYETSVKVKKSLRINKENGNFIGSSVIYGFRKNPEDIHKLIIDDEAADIVREIFNMFLLGMTKSEIAEELNKREVMTPALYKKTHNLGYTRIKKDNKWDYEMIDRILRDENYTGTLVQGKNRNENYITHKEVKNLEIDWIKFENHHEAIVDKDVFEKIKEKLKVQRRSTNKNDLLSGYLFCEDCGAPMILIKGKNNAYYYCRSNRSKGICTKHTIRQTILYNNVIDLLNKKKLDGEPINELSRDIVIKYIEKVTVYDNEKIDVILKYEDEIIKN